MEEADTNARVMQHSSNGALKQEVPGTLFLAPLEPLGVVPLRHGPGSDS